MKYEIYKYTSRVGRVPCLGPESRTLPGFTRRATSEVRVWRGGASNSVISVICWAIDARPAGRLCTDISHCISTPAAHRTPLPCACAQLFTWCGSSRGSRRNKYLSLWVTNLLLNVSHFVTLLVLYVRSSVLLVITSERIVIWHFSWYHWYQLNTPIQLLTS